MIQCFSFMAPFFQECLDLKEDTQTQRDHRPRLWPRFSHQCWKMKNHQCTFFATWMASPSVFRNYPIFNCIFHMSVWKYLPLSATWWNEFHVDSVWDYSSWLPISLGKKNQSTYRTLRIWRPSTRLSLNQNELWLTLGLLADWGSGWRFRVPTPLDLTNTIPKSSGL